MDYLRFLQSCGQEKSLRVSGTATARSDGVRLMTVHQSKGLEFPVVYLPDMVKGQFPPGKHGSMVAPPDVWTQADDKDIEDAQQGGPDSIAGGAARARTATADGPKDEDEDDEAQCLFFVALSRARDALILSRPRTWNGRPIEPSYLLQNCEPDLNACGAQRVTWTRAAINESSPAVEDRVTFTDDSMPAAENDAQEEAGANTEPLTPPPRPARSARAVPPRRRTSAPTAGTP